MDSISSNNEKPAMSDSRFHTIKPEDSDAFSNNGMETANSLELKLMRGELVRFECDQCELNFDSMEYLLVHKRFHVDRMIVKGKVRGKGKGKRRRKFECDQCDVKVNSKYHLDMHMTKHGGVASRKYVCEVCDRSFIAAQFLKSHMHMHSDGFAISCDICNKTFTGQVYLKLHMQLHNDVKQFKCSKCDELLPTKTCLNMHMKKHTKVKNFKCDYCNKLFVLKVMMEKHRATHEGQPVDCHVKCEQCDRTMHASLLRTHVQRAHVVSHNDDVKRPYKCLTCGKSFIVEINLNLHIKVCHPDLFEEDDEDDSI